MACQSSADQPITENVSSILWTLRQFCSSTLYNPYRPTVTKAMKRPFCRRHKNSLRKRRWVKGSKESTFKKSIQARFSTKQIGQAKEGEVEFNGKGSDLASHLWVLYFGRDKKRWHFLASVETCFPSRVCDKICGTPRKECEKAFPFICPPPSRRSPGKLAVKFHPFCG